jgi:hypothetical protein
MADEREMSLIMFNLDLIRTCSQTSDVMGKKNKIERGRL